MGEWAMMPEVISAVSSPNQSCSHSTPEFYDGLQPISSRCLLAGQLFVMVMGVPPFAGSKQEIYATAAFSLRVCALCLDQEHGHD